MNQAVMHVNDFPSLREHLQEKALSVHWVVRSTIGPEWIGGGRWICFYLDGQPFAESAFHTHLKERLIVAVDIPEESADAVLTGEGDIQLVGTALVVEYWWSKAIPYQEPCAYGQGKITLHSF